ncbi:hypothetical protein [Pseudomonas sp. Sample_10]|uniref:hypothetical protein n=1 Tax=Pseudomonas sp. Sample_10 TaxID=2448269 RepID=UPI0015AE8872|nr:hypothetical protein [Pseudomonas sp. Sample_10]
MIDLTVAGVVDPCGRWLASDGGLSADVILRVCAVYCGSQPAGDCFVLGDGDF